MTFDMGAPAASAAVTIALHSFHERERKVRLHVAQDRLLHSEGGFGCYQTQRGRFVTSTTDQTPAMVLYKGIRPDTLPGTSDPPQMEIIMVIRTYITSALAGALLLGLGTAAYAATGEFNNMCTEGLALGKDINTDCSINSTLKGKTYCFGSEQAKTDFMKDPEGNLAKAQSYYSKKHPG
jgi:YHS domain-containing protein